MLSTTHVTNQPGVQNCYAMYVRRRASATYLADWW